MSTEVLLMASPGPNQPLESAVDHSPSRTISAAKQTDPSTPPLLHKLGRPVHTDLAASSRESTPLSSVMDVDSLSTEPSSPPTAQPSSAVKADEPAKKHKLTFAEKEVLRIEKQFKEQQKAEEKARKEAQKEADRREREEKKRALFEEKEEKKRQQELEKAQKRRQQEEAKEEKRKAKEEKDAAKQAEVAAKEAEKKAREDEKAKRERSQLRLNAFFAKKPQSADSASSSRRNSVSSIQETSPRKVLSTVAERLEKEDSEYERLFPPFFLHAHTSLPPVRLDDPEHLRHVRASLDQCVGPQPVSPPSLKRSLDELSHGVSKRRKLGSGILAVKDLVSKLNTETIDLTDSLAPSNTLANLRSVPVKYLRYAEDVRPPYIGTYTKQPTTSVQQLCRNPFLRALPAVNYDYDSEAEWEEPEEGDNCDSNDEDSDADDDDEDMAAFLDDDDDAPKRRTVMGDMEPVTTGLQWHDHLPRRGAVEVVYGVSTLDLNQFRISPLLVEATGAIDPFSTAYWEPAVVPTDANTMAPPPVPAARTPLNPLLGTNSRLAVDASSGLSLKPPPAPAATTSTAGVSSRGRPAAKPFPPELLDEFKREIEGSDLSKLGLVEVLKKKFPQITGKTIQETLPQVAKRDGKNQAEKKWVLL